jgi:hypothetical protein
MNPPSSNARYHPTIKTVGFLARKFIRLTGKAWEIRAQQKEWAKSPLTLAQFLERNTKKGSHLRLIK